MVGMVGLVNFITPTLKHSHPVPRNPQLSSTQSNPETRTSYPATLHHTHLPSNAPALKHSNPKTHFLDAFATGL